jgi:hypothetical protein
MSGIDMDMMLFATMPFDDKEAMKDFLFNNAQSHSLIAKTIEGNGFYVESYPLSEMSNIEDWLDIHNKVHASEFAALGLTNSLPTLDNVDFNNKQAFNDWMYEHSLIHASVYAVLGLT